MEHNHHTGLGQDKKENTFLYHGGTGAFTILWMLIIVTSIFCFFYFG